MNSFLEAAVEVFKPVQLQADLFASITILVSFFGWMWKINQIRKKDVENQIADNARSVAISIIKDSVESLTEKRMKAINSTRELDNIIRMYEGLLSKYFIDHGQEAWDKLSECLDEFSLELRNFIDEAHKQKYNIYPILAAVKNGGSKVDSIRIKLAEMAETNDDIIYAWSESHDLVNFLQPGIDESILPEYKPKLQRLISRYPGGFEALLLHRKNMQYLALAECISIIPDLINKSRKSSKEYLMVLSATIHILSLPPDSKVTIDNVITKFKSDKYFDLENEIR